MELSIAAFTMTYIKKKAMASATTITNSNALFGLDGFTAGTAGSYSTASALMPDRDSSGSLIQGFIKIFQFIQ